MRPPDRVPLDCRRTFSFRHARLRAGKDFLSVARFRRGRLERCLDRRPMKADRALGPDAPTAQAAERPSRRDAVREAVAPDADDLRNRGARARRPRRRAAARRRPGRARAGRRRGAQSRALGRRRRHPDVLADGARGVRGGGQPPARHQRADRRRAPVPGARRLPHAQGTTGDRCAAGRWRSSATATTSPRRWRTRPRMLGVHFHVASPDGLSAPAHGGAAGHRARRAHGARLRLFTDPADAVAGADAVYTDTWTSMGQEAEADVRRQVFAAYQVNDELMSLAKPGALFMHCLPAHRGEEVTAEVFESRRLGRVRSGREPAARPEGAARDAARFTLTAPRPATSHQPPAARPCYNRRAMSAAAPWLAHYDAGVPPTLAPYPNRTLLDYLADAARERGRPGRPALQGRTLTYAELDRLSDACAAALRVAGRRSAAIASRCCCRTARSSSSRSSPRGRSAPSSRR